MGKKPIEVWKVVKCNCGHNSCGMYGTNNGHFPQGSGYSLEDATLIAPAALTTDLLYRSYKYLLTTMSDFDQDTAEGRHFLGVVRSTLAKAYGIEVEVLDSLIRASLADRRLEILMV